MREWLKRQSIADFIAMQPDYQCDAFANMLLGDDNDRVVATRGNNPNNVFIPAVLRLWINQAGVAVPRTWKELIRCMRAAGLAPRTVDIIEANLP